LDHVSQPAPELAVQVSQPTVSEILARLERGGFDLDK